MLNEFDLLMNALRPERPVGTCVPSARETTEGDETVPMMRSMALSLEGDDQAVYDVVAYISGLK